MSFFVSDSFIRAWVQNGYPWVRCRRFEQQTTLISDCEIVGGGGRQQLRRRQRARTRRHAAALPGLLIHVLPLGDACRLQGGKAVIARSFARIHETNLKKQGARGRLLLAP